MHVKVIGRFGSDVFATGYGVAIKRSGDTLTWRFEKNLPNGYGHKVTQWRYADE